VSLGPSDPFTNASVKTSVRFGQLYVPINGIHNIVQNHCGPVLLENATDEFQLSVAGSSFLINYRRTNLQICCLHQITNLGRKPNDVRLVHFINGKQIIFPPVNGYTLGEQPDAFANMRDLLISRYPIFDEDHVSRRFLQVDESQLGALKQHPVKRVVASFFLGFPSQILGYDLSDDGSKLEHLHARWVRMLIEPAPDALQFVPNRTYFRTKTALDSVGLDPDGISGSPIFTVFEDESGERHLLIEGMITDASVSGILAVYDAEPMRKLLDEIVMKPPARERASFS
jgi:hypothetical protein